MAVVQVRPCAYQTSGFSHECGQSSHLSTNPLRTGFPSTYSHTVRRLSSLRSTWSPEAAPPQWLPSGGKCRSPAHRGLPAPDEPAQIAGLTEPWCEDDMDMVRPDAPAIEHALPSLGRLGETVCGETCYMRVRQKRPAAVGAGNHVHHMPRRLVDHGREPGRLLASRSQIPHGCLIPVGTLLVASGCAARPNGGDVTSHVPTNGARPRLPTVPSSPSPDRASSRPRLASGGRTPLPAGPGG